MDEKPKVTVRKSKDISDGSPHLGAYILIGIGLFLLLANLGIITGILRLWPLLLIGIGAYLLYGQKSAPSEVRHEHFNAPLDNAQSARVKLDLSVGEATVGPVSDPAQLIDADVAYLGEVHFAADGGAEKFVSLGQTSHFAPEWFNPANWFGTNAYKDLRWTVGLNPTIPTDLDIHGGIGQSRIDLNRFALTALDVTSGLGEMDITLPAQSNPLEARLRVGVGKLDVTIPSGANLYATIKGGVGETHITLPADAAARVEASSGIGDLNMSSRFQKLNGNSSGISPRGVWETPNFDSAERKIVIHFEGGIGELRVR
jgi:cell wall-active antibiotic response 4TMS protein YvqF